MPVETAKADDDVPRVVRLDLEEISAVQHLLDHLEHVVGLVAFGGNDCLEVRRLTLGVIVRFLVGWRLEVVGGDKAQQVLDLPVHLVLVLGAEVGNAAPGGMRLGSAQLLQRHVLAGNGADHVRSGDKHLADVFDHENEVRHRRRVHGPTGAGSGDDRDLRHHARRADVTKENLAVPGKALNALLDASACGVVDANDRAAVALGKVHHLDHLLGVSLAKRSAEDGEILGEDGNLAALDGAEAGHDAVTVWVRAIHAELGRAMLDKGVQLHEGAFVEQGQHPIPGAALAPLRLLLAGSLVALLDRLANLREPGGFLHLCLRHRVSPSLLGAQ